MDKNAKRRKEKEEENALNHILCWLAGGVILEFLLLTLSRYWYNYTMDQFQFRLALGTGVKIGAAAALVAAAAAAFWWWKARQGGRQVNLLPGTLTLFLLGLSWGCFAAWLFPDTGLNLVCVMVPVAIVLALVYYLYQKEFFLICCQSALALAGVWLYARGGLGRRGLLCYGAAAAVLVLVTAVLSWMAQKNRGVITAKGGRELWQLSKDANYVLLYVGSVVSLLVLAGIAMGLSAVLLSAVAVAWLLIMAVYYTMKLI